LRSSPIVCTADALEALLRLLAYMYAGTSAPNAARRVVQERMWRPPRTGDVAMAADVTESEDTPLTLGNQYPLTHAVIFVLGVLPQAIKLFGMHGIPWTHASGGLYLSSFLVLAGIGALARCAGGDNDTPWEEAALGKRTMEMLRLGAVVAQVGVWVWCAWALLHLVHSSFGQSTFYQFLVFPMRSVVFFVIVLPPMAIPVSLPFGEFLRNSAFVLGFYGWAYLLYLDILDYIAIPLTLLIIAAGFAAWVAHIYSVKFETSLSILFGVANLVLSILYYRFLYHPIGTVKPSWAEKLG